ncbi:hypothetical protein BDN72DRAFT_883586 [Pluteus cervinus]|uniref:Uncharacterized protein n=1 Tax=Pluteus cervinus TaxID=181527 RepID=A0ACD3A530_9AGAR|nr:hypothetical protein BDN72DRAFT_883586 [Pluteus cervinus]
MQNKDNSQVSFSNSNVANYITNTNNNNSTQINILPALTLPQDPTALHGGSDPKALQERIKMLDDVQKKLQGNYRQNHEEACRKIIGKSAQWVLKTQEFEDWVNGKSIGFLGVGDPGVGKTCLVSLVVSHLQKLPGPARVAYVYLKHYEARSQTPTDILSMLLKQLLLTYPILPDSAVALYNHLSLDQGPPQFEVLVTALLGICTDPNFRTYIVIDALDECNSELLYQEELLSVLAKLLEKQVQVFATSRPSFSGAVSLFKEPYCSTYPIRATTDDISSFLKQKLETKDSLKGLIADQTFKMDIIQTIESKAQGVFLIAALQIQQILSLTTKNKIKEALGSFPLGLDANLGMTLERIRAQPSDCSDLAEWAMKWIAYAYKPLEVDVLLYALGTKIGSNVFDRGDLTTPNIILESCFGFVTLEGHVANWIYVLEDAYSGFNDISLLHVMAIFGFELTQELPFVLKDISHSINSRIGAQKKTPLMLASQNNHKDIVEYLLEIPDVDINAQTPDKWTALVFAIDKGHIGIVKKLLDQKNIDVRLSFILLPKAGVPLS